MQRQIMRTAVLGLTVLLCAGAAGGVWAETNAAETPDGYYAPVTATQGEELLGQLHDLITTTHTTYTTYGDCREYLPITDHAEGGPKSIVEFYTHETILEYTLTGGDVGRWNREHVWPKALSNNLWKKISNGESGGGADLHHIRPTEVQMNSDRHDYAYGEVDGGSPIYSKTTDGKNSQLGGYHVGNVFEPLDETKGDVARIIFYVYTHYNTYSNVHGTTNGDTNGQTANYFGTLPITNVVSASSEEAAVELLLAWNELDPVDELETTRNEAAFEIQGNRNPFIDHPEYAEAIWGGGEIGGGEDTSKFHRAVSELREGGTLKEQLAAINEAIRAYQALTEQGRDAAAEDVAKLQAAVSAYNETVRAQNAEAAAAEGGALGVVAGVGRS